MEFTHEAAAARVVFGAGAASSALPGEIDRLGWSRVMVVAGTHDVELGDRLTGPFSTRIAARFDGVRPHVPNEVATAARRVAADNRVDGLVSIGGGSTTGTAKAVALTTGLPILAIPTTFSGSEMTEVWGMTTDGRKQTGRDPVVRPGTVIYDPDLTATLPTPLAVASGLNAMAHCVEAFWGSAANPVASLFAREGISVLAEGLRAVQSDERRAGVEQLLYGGYLAGTAFASAGSGLHHSICHMLGGAFDLPHAETHAVVLPHVLAFNAEAIGADAERIAAALESTDAVLGLRALYDEIGAPRTLRDLGLTDEQLATAIEIARSRLPITNPRPVNATDVTMILTAAAG